MSGSHTSPIVEALRELGVEVVGDEEGRLLVAVAADYELAHLALVATERNDRLVDQRVGELPLGVGDVDLVPDLEVVDVAQKLLAAPAQGDELDPGAVELRELRVGFT